MRKTVKKFFEFNFICLQSLLYEHGLELDIDRCEFLGSIIYSVFFCIKRTCTYNIECFPAFEGIFCNCAGDVSLFEIVDEQIGIGLDSERPQLQLPCGRCPRALF